MEVEKTRIDTQPKGTRFAKWLGILKIKVAGEDFKLRPTLGHKEKLMSLQTKNKDGTLEEEDWKTQHEIFKDILRVSYPDDAVDGFNNFLLEHDLEFMMALFVGFGWAKEGDFADMKDKAKKSVGAALKV